MELQSEEETIDEISNIVEVYMFPRRVIGMARLDAATRA
jgi:hypothetical protein